MWPTLMNARFFTLAAAVLFSTGGVALKADAFSGPQMSFLRSGVAAVALMLWMRGRVTWSAQTVMVAVLYAATVTLFVGSTRLTTAAAAIFLQSSAPLYIVLLAPAWLDERFDRRELWYLAVVGGGLWWCLADTATTATAPDPATGNLLGVASGFTWAMTLLALRYTERRGGAGQTGLSAVAIGNAIACLAALPAAWPLPPASWLDWTNVVYLGAGQIALAYICLTRAARHLPAIEISLLLLVEPVLNPIWTWWLRGEQPGAPVLAGGATILLATAIRVVMTSRRAAGTAPSIS